MPFVKRRRWTNHEFSDSRIKRLRDRIAILSMQTVRVVVFEYSQLHKKA